MTKVLVCGRRRLSSQPIEEVPVTSYRGSRLARVAVIIAMQAVVAAIGASPAQAVTYWVTTVADNTTADDQCTLREAMLAANNTPANTDCGPGSAGRDDIVFGPFVPFTVLVAPLPTITDSVLILGDIAFGTTIDANGRVRAFVIDPGVDVTLSKLTITDAKAPDGHFVSPTFSTNGEDGGAIYNRGRLHLEDVRVTQSAAGRGGDGSFSGGAGGNGGAIYNAGTIVGYRVTFDENSAGAGGRALDSAFPNKTGPGGQGGHLQRRRGRDHALRRDLLAQQSGTRHDLLHSSTHGTAPGCSPGAGQSSRRARSWRTGSASPRG